LSTSFRNLARGWAYLSPNFFGFLVFTALPVLAIFVVAFTKGDYTSELDPLTGSLTISAEWCGIDHFVAMTKDTRLWQSPFKGYSALWNTFVLMFSIPLQMGLALLLAILINTKIPARIVYRTVLFLPTIAAGLALYMIWRQLYNQDFGLLNGTLETLGLFAEGQGPDWLGDPRLAKASLLVMLVWIAMGGTNMILYLAALQDVPRSLYEAASIDGASPWSMFRFITWPALRPTTFFILTTNLIGGIQIFDQVLIMTGGGPEGATSTILYYIYQNLYEYEGQIGYAAALSVLLFVIVFGITVVNWLLNSASREA
jgi:multiple sugar transport system permease protein